MRYTTAQRDALLYIALISMFCDHAAYLFPAVQEGLHSIGRIAFLSLHGVLVMFWPQKQNFQLCNCID